ncbi:SIS domain-containing protein [Actinomadura alba]|uniref:SIS domain-containing protein n=2 Tax=Actinomadura alba TaxID=406431 RepID=A0ABR7LT53_9ACTN|nr:SIS domain-containing protein [Actinomadura alba]
MPSAPGQMARLFEKREAPGRGLANAAGEIAATCHSMAIRFHRGGRLFTFGNGGAATDAQHMAVEFVHPVIMGKQALPALSLTGDIATLTGVGAASGFGDVFAHQLRYLAQAGDIALGVSPDGRCDNVLRGFEAARHRGLLTVALLGGDGGAIAPSPAVDHALVVRSDDQRVVKEVHVTMYHVLWELVHVFFERPSVLVPGAGL